jgi:hypothetical protein
VNYYKPGSWNADCAVCGFRFKADELLERWDGQQVCKHDYESRHPADLLRVPKEDPSVPWTSQEPTDVFIETIDALTTEEGVELTTEEGAILQAEA